VGSSTCTSNPSAKESVLLQVDHAANVRVSVSRSGVPEHSDALEASPSLSPEWATGPEQQESGPNSTFHEAFPNLIQEANELWRSGPSAKELEHFNLVKAERQRGWTCPDGTYFPPNNGEFEFDCRLWRAARLWSQRMGTENFVAHQRQGSTSCQRTEAQGFPRLRGCGENIAAGNGSPQGAIQQLKESNNHCKNMFEPKFNKLGVGYFRYASSMYQDYWTDSFGDWHYGPDQVCIGGSPAGTPAPGCADIDTMNCQTYKNQGLCDVSPNVQAQCKDTCGIGNCGNRQPSPGNCEDTTGSCDYYRSAGYCQTSDNVKRECKRTCGLCGGAPASPACEDTTGSCDYYRNAGYCQTSDNVKRECKRTCGFC
jgi:hypothetical protein